MFSTVELGFFVSRNNFDERVLDKISNGTAYPVQQSCMDTPGGPQPKLNCKWMYKK